GARVILVDEQAEMGGSFLTRSAPVDGVSGDLWLEQTLAELAAQPETRLLSRTTAYGHYDHNYYALLERVADHKAVPASHEPRERLWHVRARQAVFTTGAIERPLVFSDNDRPGIMLASAIETYIRRYAVLPGKRALIATNNDTAYQAALALADAGA